MNTVVKILLPALVASSVAVTSFAQDATPETGDDMAFVPIASAEADLADFLWVNRPIVVFADTHADPRFQEQLDLLMERVEELTERDVVVIVDTDPAAASDIRTKLRPRGFQLTLIGKDGGVKLRKPFPWNVREITRVIDKMPMRQREIRERGAE